MAGNVVHNIFQAIEERRLQLSRNILPAILAMLLAVGACLSGCSHEEASDDTAEPAATATNSMELEEEATAGEKGRMDGNRIVVTVNGRNWPATLEDTEAAREFSALLPLTLQMEELNGNEKYAYLDDPLPTASYNPETIHAGDIMLFGSSCVVLFYDTFPTRYTYTPIAHLDDADGLAQLLGEGDVEARIAPEQ